MNYRGVLFLLGRLLLALAVALLVPTAVSWALGEGNASAFGLVAALAAVAGLVAQVWFRQPAAFRFGRSEAFLLVTCAWLMASVVGALPYVLVKGPAFAIDGLFESASGFTTTGASVLVNVEGEPRSLLLWRSLTQWLGGMGIIVLGIAILPKLAVGGMQLLGAEAPGPIAEKLTPRIAQTAKALWAIYALLTLLEVGALMAFGMGVFDAVNHAMTTMSSGGFSTRNASVGAFAHPGIHIVVVVFMVLAGMNFALHFQLLRGGFRRVWIDSELRFYFLVLGVGTALLTVDLLYQGHVANFADALLGGAFQAVTVVTTTGFATVDFDGWPSFSRALLFLMMFVGGCAGSTGGSVKVARLLILAKKLAVDLEHQIRPRAVLPVRLGRKAVPDDVVASVATFFILFLALFATGSLLLAAMGLDPITAFSASAACLGNIGPGFGLVGPTQTYAFLPSPAKLLLVAMMIVGRLELYTVLVTLFLSRRLF